jgi:Protein of unknown function (DUF1552)
MSNRRTFLRHLGLAGTGAYFFPSLARAATPPPKRLVIFYTSHGCMPGEFRTLGVGGNAPTSTSYNLSPLHQPLMAFKNKMTLLSGLDMTGRDLVTPAVGGCGHAIGTVMSLSGRGQNPNERTLGLGPSIDQYIVAKWKAANGGMHPTSLPSLQLAAMDTEGFGPYGNPILDDKGNPLPHDINPVDAYKRIFPNGPPTGMPPDINSPAAKLIRQRRSVLDFVKAEYDSSKVKLGALERQRLEQHATFVTDLSNSLVQPVMPTGCNATPGPSPRQPGERFQYNVSNMIRVAQLALSCDVTRVIAINVRQIQDELVPYVPLQFGTADLHQLIHGAARGYALEANVEAQKILKNYHLRYSEIFAQLLQALDAVTEPDGSKLLDNCAVLWSGELAEGDHGTYNCKWILAGGASGALKMGRSLVFGDAMRSSWSQDKTAPTNNDLFCNLATALGVPTTTFGLPAACKGPISALM